MTKFTGHRTGFNKSGSNDCTPNRDGQTTTFRGRPFTPTATGKLQRTPSLTGATSEGNRRLAKSGHGDGGGMPTRVQGVNAFSSKSAPGGKSRTFNTGGGVGSGFRKGGKKP